MVRYVISAAALFVAVAGAWLGLEMAFKPILDKARSIMGKSDPAKDPDDVDDESPKPSPDIAKASSSDSSARALI